MLCDKTPRLNTHLVNFVPFQAVVEIAPIIHTFVSIIFQQLVECKQSKNKFPNEGGRCQASWVGIQEKVGVGFKGFKCFLNRSCNADPERLAIANRVDCCFKFQNRS